MGGGFDWADVQFKVLCIMFTCDQDQSYPKERREHVYIHILALAIS